MAKKKATKKKAAKAAGKPPTKSEIYSAIADKTGLAKKEVAGVFDELQVVIKKSLKANGIFAMPGLCKMVVRKRPPQKSRLVRNPATGEMIMSKPKPASKAVRIRPLKNLKDMI